MRLFGQTSGLPILLLVKADTQIPMDRTRKCCWYMKKKIKIIKKKWTFHLWILESVIMEPFIEVGC